jgi:hypothetical protein
MPVARVLGAALIAVVLSVGAAGCGGDQAIQLEAPEAAGAGPNKRETARTTLCFLTDDGHAPLGVRRSVELVPPAEGSRVRGAVLALLEGPTPSEQAAGITTAVPKGVTLRSLSFRGRGGTGAVIELAGLPPVKGTDPLTRVRVITQVARTVIGVSSIERIWLRSEGEPWDLGLIDGGSVDTPTDYGRLLGFRVGAAKPGTEAVTGDYFKALP